MRIRTNHLGGTRVEPVESPVEYFDLLGQTKWSRGLQRSMMHWIGLTGQQNVLEVGCGTGQFAALLAQRAHKVVALDSSKRMLVQAESNFAGMGVNNVETVLGNVRALPFADDTFDVVICMNLVFLFEDETVPMRELTRVVRPGGHVLVLGPSSQMNPWSALLYCEKNHAHDFERESLLSWSTAAAKRDLLSHEQFVEVAEQCGAKVVHHTDLLDGLASLEIVQSK